MSNQLFVLLPCAGSGLRFGSEIPKQYIKINGKSVLMYTLGTFLAMPEISQIVIVVDPQDQYIDKYAKLSPKIKIVKVGGKTRGESVLNGLSTIECANQDWVLVHDAARCCITVDLVRHLIGELVANPVGGILAIPITDTLKIKEEGMISHTLDRTNTYLAQTPQMFRYEVLLKALNSCALETITDESSSVEKLGLKVRLIDGDIRNIKLTYPTDVHLAKIFLDNK